MEKQPESEATTQGRQNWKVKDVRAGEPVEVHGEEVAAATASTEAVSDELVNDLNAASQNVVDEAQKSTETASPEQSTSDTTEEANAAPTEDLTDDVNPSQGSENSPEIATASIEPEDVDEEDEELDAQEDEESEEQSKGYSCKLAHVLEALCAEADDEEEADLIRQTFLLLPIGYVDDKSFDKFIKQLIREEFSKKLVRAAQKQVEELDILGEALLDHKIFGTDLDIALRDQMEMEEVDVLEEFRYLSDHISLSLLSLEDCVFTEEDLAEETLVRRIPGGQPIETDSRYGKALEALVKAYGKPQYNATLREVITRYAVGLMDEVDFTNNIRMHKRFFKATHYNRVSKQMTDQLFDMFNKIILFNADPETVIEYVGKVTMEDWEYIKQVINVDAVLPNHLLFADRVEPMVIDEEKEEA